MSIDVTPVGNHALFALQLSCGHSVAIAKRVVLGLCPICGKQPAPTHIEVTPLTLGQLIPNDKMVRAFEERFEQLCHGDDATTADYREALRAALQAA